MLQTQFRPITANGSIMRLAPYSPGDFLSPTPMQTLFSSRLTICIPVWERYDYFENAVRSVLRQTMLCQLLVIDNASSHDRFKDFCWTHHIQYFRNSTNVGLYGNWNRCVQEARTKYVMILSDDDELHPIFVQEFEAKASEIDIDFYFTNITYRTDEGDHEWPMPAIFGEMDGTEVQKYALNKGLGIPSVSGVYRRHMLVEEPWMESPSGSNDWLWLYSKFGEMRVFGNRERLYIYRKHSNADSVLRFDYIYYLNYPAIYLAIGKALDTGCSLANAQLIATKRAEKMLKDYFTSRGPSAWKALHEMKWDDPYRVAIYEVLRRKSFWVRCATTRAFYSIMISNVFVLGKFAFLKRGAGSLLRKLCGKG